MKEKNKQTISNRLHLQHTVFIHLVLYKVFFSRHTWTTLSVAADLERWYAANTLSVKCETKKKTPEKAEHEKWKIRETRTRRNRRKIKMKSYWQGMEICTKIYYSKHHIFSIYSSLLQRVSMCVCLLFICVIPLFFSSSFY